jgi:predicted Zn finger-like uncharacterized protein
MRLICPSCSAAYDVPDHRLGGGARRLRCTRCAHEWKLEPAPEAPPPEPPRLYGEPRIPLAAAFPDVQPAVKQPTLDRQALVAWAASIVVLVGLGVAAVQFRAEVMQGWPPSQRVYAVFGAMPG